MSRDAEKSRRLVGVAIIDGDGRVWSLLAPARHHDVIRAIRAAGAPFVQDDRLQGFVDASGAFYGRLEAIEVARAAGQIKAPKWPPKLYSEDLW